MKNNKLIYSLLLSFGLIVATSCDETFEEINTSKNSPTAVSSDVLLTAALNDQFNNFGGFGTGYIGVFTQHFAGNHAFGVDMDQYNLDNGSWNGQWTGYYRGPMRDLIEIMNVGAENEDWHYVGVAKIMMAFALGTLTDMYGDIPWSQAFNIDEYLTQTYDSQESIYNEIQRLLTEAVSDLGKTTNLPLQGDFVHGNSTSNWIATAHLLSARYHNHLSKRDPSGSATRALAAVDAAKAAGLTSANDFRMKYEGTAQHRNPWYAMWENNQVIAAENFMLELQNTNDPRLEAYWDDDRFPVGSDPVGFVGKQNGFGITNLSFSPIGPDTFYGKLDSDHFLATYFELLFIEAEAAFRSGDMARAATAHNSAVQEQIGIVVADAADPRIAPYIATYASETAGTITLEKIMTEKYKAMFTMEIESWVDIRRHDFAFPNTLIIPTRSDGSQVATEYICRVLYPQDELNNNAANVPSGLTIFSKSWLFQ
ncbi:SusD/RagB family nutrient-binding outer membrane lipoprotein [Fulvivirgaceae bacterium BMA10]|uniref:SusD/RagB family nutrient-binding outer membrane lipoprotein n=1 Tax=Splendidivirga corallicola TaxID=3051826 RepID=A0ABT8KK54_9BACT|nr:SusD/RagB family nutrient-binding outer membrane lipoprotein [Fulvivirgaceae bacterium BMA10]